MEDIAATIEIRAVYRGWVVTVQTDTYKTLRYVYIDAEQKKMMKDISRTIWVDPQ